LEREQAQQEDFQVKAGRAAEDWVWEEQAVPVEAEEEREESAAVSRDRAALVESEAVAVDPAREARAGEYLLPCQIREGRTAGGR
jgi:hypothetical protein